MKEKLKKEIPDSSASFCDFSNSEMEIEDLMENLDIKEENATLVNLILSIKHQQSCSEE